jgi:hypothetical protein
MAGSDSALVPIDVAMLALIRDLVAKGGKLQPFAREIMLIECNVAGTSHRELQAVEPGLQKGSILVLQREPGNAHDPLAIMILDEAGHHLGYVPRSKNEALARLMDAGKLLFGLLDSKEWRGQWLCVQARVFLRDL